jgi:hypothetical protein
MYVLAKEKIGRFIVGKPRRAQSESVGNDCGAVVLQCVCFLVINNDYWRYPPNRL